MNVDKDRFPRWVWLLIGLFAMAILANAINVLVLFEAGLPERYGVVTVIAGMAPVIVYVGVWYDEDRQHYWEHSRLRIAGDVTFLALGTIAGATVALAGIVDTGLPTLVQDLLAMTVGFLAGWVLFYFRNPDLYFADPDQRR
ncbi:hypothetical protein [Halovivax sp.]|uniref:hypothetical protein n=1 Tax=Halovivax sp. TaxID=1935978 RepID=UPI0025B83734|nr:hypothetical protein [Halovivax sp.]